MIACIQLSEIINNRETTPSISDRTTNQLLEILENPSDWRADIVEKAKTEFIKRGGVLTDIENTIKSNEKYKRKKAVIKKQATYSYKEITLIILLGPILVLLLDDLFPFWKGHAYRKMNFQGVFFGILGLVLWVIVGLLLLKK
jgi:hypothetical protein